MSEKNEDLVEQIPDYATDYGRILDTPLTVKNIETYAEEAIDNLIGFIERVTGTYARQPTITFDTDRDTESVAFRYFKLDDVESTLDYIASKADEIRNIDRLIDDIEEIDTVIIPPDSDKAMAIVIGNGDFYEKAIIPRLKTLIFILSNEFDIDLKDPEQLVMKKGKLGANMLRKESYCKLEIKSLDRTVFVCDEEGNATFVFNSALLHELGVTNDDLMGLTKNDLIDLIDKNSNLGHRIVFSNHFVPEMISALGDERDNSFDVGELDEARETVGTYLLPKAPEDYRTIMGIASELSATYMTIVRAVNALGGALGDVGQYRFGKNNAKGYAPLQVEIIHHYLENRGLYAEEAPDGYLSINGVAAELGVTNRTIARATSVLAIELGEVRQYKFGSRSSRGYSPDQLAIIRHYLEDKGLYSEQSPDGYLSTDGVAAELGIAHKTATRAIEDLGDALGDVRYYIFGNKPTKGYSSQQLAIIRHYLEDKGLYSEQSPAGYVALSGAASQLGVSVVAAARAIEELGDALGDVKHYIFGNKPTKGYSPDQIDIIRHYLENRGLYVEEAPDGYLSINGMITELGVGRRSTIVSAIEDLGSRLGVVKKYKFNTTLAEGYSPKQIEIIREYLNDKRMRKISEVALRQAI